MPTLLVDESSESARRSRTTRTAPAGSRRAVEVATLQSAAVPLTTSSDPSASFRRRHAHLLGEFSRFLVVGGISAALNFGCAWLFRRTGGEAAWFEAAVLVGFIAGALSSFVLNRSITFRVADEKILPQFIRFFAFGIVSALVAALVADGCLLLLHYLLSFHIGLGDLSMEEKKSLAHLATIGAMIFFNFIGIRRFAFSKSFRPTAETA